MWSRAVVAVVLVLVAVSLGGAGPATGDPGRAVSGPDEAASEALTVNSPQMPSGGSGSLDGRGSPDSPGGPDATAGDLATRASEVGTNQVENATLARSRELMAVEVLANGSANWTVVTTVPLDGGNRTAAFEQVASAFERGEVGSSLAAFRRAAAAASEATNRKMNLTGVSRSATLLRVENTTPGTGAGDPGASIPTDRRVPTLAPATTRRGEAALGGPDNTTVATTTTRRDETRAVGRFVLSFRWSNFANVSEDVLRVGDAFETPSGTWLPGLGANQTLVVIKPFGYVYLRAPIGPEQGALRWSGPREFEPGQPSVVYVRRGQQGNAFFTDDPLFPGDDTPEVNRPTTTPTATTPNPTATRSPTEPPATDRLFPLVPAIGVSPWTVIGAAILLVVLALAAGAWWRRSGGASGTVSDDSSDGSSPKESSPGGSPASEPSSGDAPSREPSSTGPAGDSTLDAEDGSAPSRTRSPPKESTGSVTETGGDALLTDEERVEALLEDHDGRMRQAEIVTRTDWSNAKVSQLLSGMAEADRIEKLRLGRENLISLPENGDSGSDDVRDDGEEAADTDGTRR